MWSSPSDEVLECLMALQAETDLQIQQDSDMSAARRGGSAPNTPRDPNLPASPLLLIPWGLAAICIGVG